MHRIQVTPAHEIVIDRGCTARLGTLLDELGVDRPRSVVTNTTVGPLHGARAAEALGAPPPIELPDGEAYKRWGEVASLFARWLEAGLHRQHTVTAVGGGVVTDLVGFAAAVYLRGIRWLAVPTTLLAMVDAAVGGKTGFNLPQGKNLVGAFWPPRLVVVDSETLTTLPVRELRAGLVEVVKVAWIGDHVLLDLLARPIADYGSIPPSAWDDLVVRAVQVKANVVRRDLRESGARKALNLGHTLGHALEAATEYQRFLHGEAVAWGIQAAARLAHNRGLLGREEFERLCGVLSRLGPFPSVDLISVDDALDRLAVDKKRDDLGVGWVLPTNDGVVLDQRVSADELRQVLGELKRFG
jgi:3-dehydroquinate synthase